jgi:undecaprenyl-diphosphatase
MTAKGDTRAVVIPAIVLVVTALLAARDRLLVGETALVEAINGSPLLTPIGDLLQGIMTFGTLLGVVVIAVVTAFALRPWQPAVAVLVAGVAAWFIADLVKGIVDRGRPVELLDPRTLDISVGYRSLTGAGYPSGHAAIAFALATVLAPWVPARFRWVPWALAVTVGVARLYVAAHFPLDVIGGAALGMVCGGGVNLVAPTPAELNR